MDKMNYGKRCKGIKKNIENKKKWERGKKTDTETATEEEAGTERKKIARVFA